MNKPLPPPRLDDLVEDLNGLSIVGGEPKNLPPRVENLKGLSLAEEEPAYLPPRVENLDGLSLNDRQPSQKKCSALPPQRRSELLENRNARSLAGKKLVEKKFPDLPISHQTTFVGGSDSDPAANTEIEGNRCPLAPLLPNVRQKGLAAPPEVTAVPSNQVVTPIPAPQDTTTKSTLVPSTAIIRPRRRSDSILSPKAVGKPPVSAGLGPTQPVINVTPRPHPVLVTSPATAKSSSGSNTARCSGITRHDVQCRRIIKLPATHFHRDLIPVLYCHQHRKEMLTADGCYVRTVADSEDRFVKFDDYIPKYLQVDTNLALREEMVKLTSSADEPGYIYAFEIRDPKRPDVMKLKVGRAVKLNQRLSQWDKQCGPIGQNVLRGWWPGTVDGTGGTLLKANIKAGDPGPFCHRVERLVHIELSDLSLYTPYLHSSWPDNMSTPPPGAGASGRTRKTTAKKTCLFCGTVHAEIFTFRRPEEGRFKGEEWNLIVKPVIEKWGRFVKEYHA